MENNLEIEKVESAIQLDGSQHNSPRVNDPEEDEEDLEIEANLSYERKDSIAESDINIQIGDDDDISDPEAALLKKMGISATDAKPTGAQVHKALKYFDLGLKFELLLVS